MCLKRFASCFNQLVLNLSFIIVKEVPLLKPGKEARPAADLTRICLVPINLQKAYDTLSHATLFENITNMTIQNCLKRWIVIYMCECSSYSETRSSSQGPTSRKVEIDFNRTKVDFLFDFLIFFSTFRFFFSTLIFSDF